MRTTTLISIVLCVLCIFVHLSFSTGKGEGQPIESFILEELGAPISICSVPVEYMLKENYNESVLQQIQYSFNKDKSTRWELFSLEDGIVRTAVNIDRETICPTEHPCIAWLHIDVTPPHIVTENITFRLEIIDINDNKPTFASKNMTLAISETTALGTAFSLPTATDKDLGSYSISGYELVPQSELFALEVTNVANEGGGHQELSLKLVGRLDHEVAAFHTLKLVAHDGDSKPLSGSLILNVTVTNINDHDPLFDNATYKVSITENKPSGTVIATVHARDFNMHGHPTIFTFDVHTQTNYGDFFIIDSLTGRITTKVALDYELGVRYVLLVTAFDQDADSWSPVPVSVYVKVVDDNDNTPDITIIADSISAAGEIRIPEDTEVGMNITQVIVSDMDRGFNGRVECELQAPAAFVLRKVHQGKFQVATALELDRETREEYVLSLTCHDLGDEPNFAYKDIVIRVTDINDNVPVFSKSSYPVRVPKDQPLRQYFLRVQATDPDAGNAGQIQYSIHQNAADRFMVDSSGSISLRTHINIDLGNIHFRVVATDLGSPAKSSTATIIISTGPLEPDFTSTNFEFAVYENFPMNSKVGVVSLRDALPGEFNFAFVRESGDDFSHMFAIGAETGIITTKALFDRELRPAYYLTVRAMRQYQSGSSGTVSITIYISDKNDNGPMLIYPTETNHTVFIKSDTVVGTDIAAIRAHDPDLGDNGKIIYSITSGNEDDIFSLHPTAGVITLISDITNSNTPAYSLSIRVADNGAPRFMTIAKLDIVLNRELYTAVPEIPHVAQRIDVVDSSFATVVVAVTAATLITAFLVLFAIMIFLVWRRMKPNSGSCQESSSYTDNKYSYSNMQPPVKPSIPHPGGEGGGGGCGDGSGRSGSNPTHPHIQLGRGKNMELLIGTCPAQQPGSSDDADTKYNRPKNTDVCLSIDSEKPQTTYVDNNMFLQGNTPKVKELTSIAISDPYTEDSLDSDESFIRTSPDSYGNRT